MIAEVVAVFCPSDTIVAIATPPGRGGIGVVRVSGPDASTIARELITYPAALQPRFATLTKVRTGSSTIDDVIATYFPAPASYTGDDVVEISAHGSPVVLRQIVSAAVGGGARLAEPGEFTLRAFLNGRIDLPQAEAVGDLIDAVTPLQARAAFDQLQGTLTGIIGAIDERLFDLIARLEASVDFPEEGYHFVDARSLTSGLDDLIGSTSQLLASGARGRIVREGLNVAIVGKSNVGKSSLFNALAGAPRAIVTAIPGTTRDVLTETIDFDGLRVTLVDTAGVRETTDVVETEGVRRAIQTTAIADLVLVVFDGSKPRDQEDCRVLMETSESRRVLVKNKADLPSAWSDLETVSISALSGDGLPDLGRAILAALDVDTLADRPDITNVRHIEQVRRAHDALVRARDASAGAGGPLPEEFVLADLQEARAALEEVRGRRAPDDLLAHIFSRFCIGK